MNTRAVELRQRIEKFKVWGGHSAIPQKVVTMETFRKVKSEVSEADAPALLILMQDDDYATRSLATSLFECISPSAERQIEALLAAESDARRRSRWQDAMIAIHVAKAGDSACK